MKDAIIDFESFYSNAISVVGLGVPNYVTQADAYAVSVFVDNQVTYGTLDEMADFCSNLHEDQTVRPVAANSNFDQGWWEKYFGPFAHDWWCILDQAAFHQFPRNLANLAGIVLGEKVDKTLRDEMRGKHFEELSSEKQKAMLAYCANDTIQEAACMARMGPMSAIEEKIAAHTRLINRRGVCINTDLVESDKTKLEMMRFEALQGIPWHKESPPLSYAALVRYCGARNIPVPKSLAKTDDECTALITDSKELAVLVGFMRRFRRSNTVLRKLESLMLRVTSDEILPLDLMYCGAPHTRRWSSRGFNVQNLDKEPLDVGHGQTIWTRNWIVPPPGYRFLIADLRQIEPRCLHWLAGDEAMMEALRAGFSIYEAFARAEGWKGQPNTLKKELDIKSYTLLKNRSLGLGYGMGATRFESYVHENGGEITPSEAKRVVTSFRSKNPKIVAFWTRLDNLVISAARDKSRHLTIEMPTGDLLQHFFIRTTGRKYESFTTKGDFGQQSRQPNLWGGTLTENVTQRMARDILAAALVQLEEAGLLVAFSVHDEAVLEIPIGSEKEAAAEAQRILTTSPEWAPNLPLGVDIVFADAYIK